MLTRFSCPWMLLLLLMFCAVSASAQDEPPATSTVPGYSSPRVDFGIVVSDQEKAVAFYRDVLGMTEARKFELSAEDAVAVGLTAQRPLTVRVMTLGEGPAATAVKLVAVPGSRAARPDNRYIESTLGVRYLTLYVTDLAAALERAKGKKSQPIAKGPIAVPEEIASGMGLAILRDPDGNFVELVGPWKGNAPEKANTPEKANAPETETAAE